MVEPENMVLTVPREMRPDMKEMRAGMADMATKSDLANTAAYLRSEIHSLRADVSSEMVLLEKRLGDRIGLLNRAVMEYHSSGIATPKVAAISNAIPS